MIIVSQDKDMIINWNNIEYIQIVNKAIVCSCIGTICGLGEYNTEEECRNVFAQLITDINLNLHSNYCCIIYMPQSGDINED